MSVKRDLRWYLFKYWASSLIVLGLKKRAREVFEAGDKAGAISLYKIVVQRSDAPAYSWYNLGFLQEEIGQVEDAEYSFRKALNLDEKMDLAWYGLGLTLIQQRRFDEAIKALKKNTQLQPMSPYGWYQLARVYVDRQEPEEAVKIIRHLKDFEPKFAKQLERETGLTV
jgi:tetratricopeptide (TPR) repeat protein